MILIDSKGMYTVTDLYHRLLSTVYKLTVWVPVATFGSFFKLCFNNCNRGTLLDPNRDNVKMISFFKIHFMMTRCARQCLVSLQYRNDSKIIHSSWLQLLAIRLIMDLMWILKRNWMWEDVRDCERPRRILDCMHRRWRNGLTKGMKW